MPREKKINKIVLAVDGNCKKKREGERERKKILAWRYADFSKTTIPPWKIEEFRD